MIKYIICDQQQARNVTDPSSFDCLALLHLSKYWNDLNRVNELLPILFYNHWLINMGIYVLVAGYVNWLYIDSLDIWYHFVLMAEVFYENSGPRSLMCVKQSICSWNSIHWQLVRWMEEWMTESFLSALLIIFWYPFPDSKYHWAMLN